MNIKYITFLYKNIRQKAKRYVFFLHSYINIYTCVDMEIHIEKCRSLLIIENKVITSVYKQILLYNKKY